MLPPPAPALFFLHLTQAFIFSDGGVVIVVNYGFYRVVNTFISPNGGKKNNNKIKPKPDKCVGLESRETRAAFESKMCPCFCLYQLV